ncbi:MAG: BatA and WFA domain-containing protein [Sedimentisphaerales bacterium]
MSFLYPLFLAGIAAVSLPIILHMIRRQTRKRVTFSSLMFLRTAVPRFKNRSHIENLPLLILRCIILCLLAFAFSRPFFPREEGDKQVPLARRTVLLIDTSASMRRTGMWPRAIGEAQSALRDVSGADRVCVMKFDQGTETLIGFEQWDAMDSARRTAVAAEQLSELSPGWASTNLGHALVSAAEAIEDDEINDEQQKFRTHRIVLISDLQKGSSLEALQAYEWPEALELEVKLIAAAGSTNAGLQLIASRDHLARTAGKELPSVRITNSPDAAVERFGLSWAGEDPAGTSDRITEVYVPAGHSVVVRAPQRTDSSAQGKLVLTGDDHDFDNALYTAPRLTHQVSILFIGSDSVYDSEGMLYYVQRAFRAIGSIDPAVISRSSENLTDADVAAAHLIVAADAISPGHIDSVRRYLETGRTVLLVMKSPDTAKTIAALAGIETIESQEADVSTYAMLNRIEFKHPLLAPFSEPRFGDFTRIHFWKYRQINIDDLPGAKVLAWFDSNDPALFELHVAKGSLLVLASGWHPSDSQLALSSKFVPLLYSVLEYGGVFISRQSQYFVGDYVPISPWSGPGSANMEIRKPDDSVIPLNAGEESFTQTDLPGIYTIESSAGNHIFALNLPAKECQTAVMPIEDLEMLGVTVGSAQGGFVSRASSPRFEGGTPSTLHRVTPTFVLESEQKIWRWIFIGLLVVSFIEIALAGWLTHSPSNLLGEQT